MSIWGLYKRAMAMLVVERRQTIVVVLSGIALGIVPIAEQVLLARVVDALALGQGAFPIIGLWAVLGLIGIIAGVVVAVTADRLAQGLVAGFVVTPTCRDQGQRAIYDEAIEDLGEHGRRALRAEDGDAGQVELQRAENGSTGAGTCRP